MAKVDEALAELTAASPRDFVKARAALAARLKKEGASEAAETVAAMKRPPVAVWVVNRLAREAGDTIAALIEASDQVKATQLGGGSSPGALGAATTRQRRVLAELIDRALTFLREAGVRGSAELRRRIETTLMAGTSDTESRAALRKGRLERELEPLGFDVYAGTALPPRGQGQESARSLPRTVNRPSIATDSTGIPKEDLT